MKLFEIAISQEGRSPPLINHLHNRSLNRHRGSFTAAFNTLAA